MHFTCKTCDRLWSTGGYTSKPVDCEVCATADAHRTGPGPTVLPVPYPGHANEGYEIRAVDGITVLDRGRVVADEGGFVPRSDISGYHARMFRALHIGDVLDAMVADPARLLRVMRSERLV